MPYSQQQIQNAQNNQFSAAHDTRSQIRLIAGPGSGKSYAIQERVDWLLGRGIMPNHIFVISFTRASTLDLRNRISRYCQDRGHATVDQVSISTLHSLALKVLRSAGLLSYPADPLVLDDWEQKIIFDDEFSKASGYKPGQNGVGYTPSRCEAVRRDYEAYCGTGLWSPPNYIPPDPPITPTERQDYQRFHGPRTQTYSCVLPGEIVRQCVTHVKAGTLNPASLLGIEHLIVDEYQDLNPSDLEFIDAIIANGIVTFIAGDDDQSIYSFRFASPAGIQSFVNRFPQAGQHELSDCFRCSTDVLRTAQSLIINFSEPNRIPKNLVSVYATATPPEAGIVHRWLFPSAVQEARSIAYSCRDLIAAGIPHREIMILLSNTRAQLPTLRQEFDKAGVVYESPRTYSFIDTNPGRFILAVLRVICEQNDYIAHRLILGLRPHIGAGICNNVAGAVIAYNLNFKDLFYQTLPTGVFRGAQLSALNGARDVCSEISSWQLSETIQNRSGNLFNLITHIYGQQIAQEWTNLLGSVPSEMTIEELRDYLWAETDEQQAAILETVYVRLNMTLPVNGLVPLKVRIMTMHGAKGLNTSIVFVPGLIEEILPGERKRPYPGLVLESARMLYVSITRARAACILSYAGTQIAYGQFVRRIPSRFTTHLSGPFTQRSDGLNAIEINSIVSSYQNL
jgi:superfamily I DNA/RNA helicase